MSSVKKYFEMEFYFTGVLKINFKVFVYHTGSGEVL